MRVALGEGLDGRQADLLEGVVDERLLGLPGRREAVDAQCLGDEVARAQARVEDGVGVLVDELGAAPQRAQLAARERGHVLAVEQHGAGGRVEEAQGGERHGRLAGARLADQGEELAAVEEEADPVDGARHLAAAAREAVAERALEREVHGEVAHLEEVLGGGARLRARRCSREPPLASAWQAATWPSPASCGRSAQASNACGQRGAKAQPLTGSSRRGGVPGMETRGRSRLTTGVASRSSCV